MNTITSVLLIGWEENRTFLWAAHSSANLLLLIYLSNSVRCPIRLETPRRVSKGCWGQDMTWALYECHLNFSNVISSLCKHPAARHLSLFVKHLFLTTSLLSGISDILLILCIAICFNCLDKVNGLINVCVWEILWARFLHSLEEFSAFFFYFWGHWLVQEGVLRFDLNGSVNWMLKAWHGGDGSAWLRSELFVSRCLSHNASREQLSFPLSRL